VQAKEYCPCVQTQMTAMQSKSDELKRGLRTVAKAVAKDALRSIGKGRRGRRG
jgi:hypothetical protein